MIKEERLRELLYRFAENALNKTEEEELMRLLVDPELKQSCEILISELYDRVPAENRMTELQGEMIFRKLMEAKVVPVRRLFSLKWVAAAAVIILLAGGYLFYKSQIPNSKSQIVDRKDVTAPNSNKATLQLADGRIIFLDSLGNGQLSIGPSTSSGTEQSVVQKKGDEISYQLSVPGSQSSVQYNTLSNPRGSKIISLVLHDGSKVWLNSESSIRYPVAFSGLERKVEITGEGYFEVAKDPGKKFIVVTGNVTTEVLGTHFNVNSYDDADGVKVTLLEGKVRVKTTLDFGPKTLDLIPGQQAFINKSATQLVSNPDLEQTMAWKNGFFLFNNADIKEILSQAARWYDVELRYEDGVSPERFKGKISRTTNLSTLLKALEINGVKWKLEGRKLTILK